MEQAMAECSHISKWIDVMTEMLGKVQIFDNYNNLVLVHTKQLSKTSRNSNGRMVFCAIVKEAQNSRYEMLDLRILARRIKIGAQWRRCLTGLNAPCLLAEIKG